MRYAFLADGYAQVEELDSNGLSVEDKYAENQNLGQTELLEKQDDNSVDGRRTQSLHSSVCIPIMFQFL
jgi:hypothetical protein